MTRTPRPSFLGALRFGTDSDAHADEQAFLQGRVALFALVGALVALGFFLLANSVMLALADEYTVAGVLQNAGNRIHLGAIGLGFLFWAALRFGRPSRRGLLFADVALTVSVLSAYAGMTLVEFTARPERVDLVMLLITMIVLTLRAVLVPSSPLQTLAVTSLACVPAVTVGTVVGRHAPSTVAHFAAPVYAAIWSLVIVVVATFTSRVIYGLRSKAAEARRLGQYLLDEKVGEGGMGTVYRARHALLRRPTAIKLLPLEKVGAQTIARFEREVQHTSSLTHPNTVSIYDYGRTPDGVFYYAMEYLDGVDLQDLVDQTGPQDPRRVVHVLAQAAGALAEAHAEGLVHRDVKPANIVLCERGGAPDTVKVVDFGLVKDVTNTDSTLSTVNTIVGTPLYMAPEAIVSPDTVSGSADIYALGAVGYFLLTGVPPFEGQSVVEVCSQHLHQTPVPPSVKLGHALPEKLEQVILACLAKKPEDRPDSARALRDALARAGLEPWTEADAAAFYVEHPLERLRAPTAPTVRQAADSPSVVSVDLAHRAPAE